MKSNLKSNLMKKFLSVFLIFVMTIAMTATVFADNTNKNIELFFAPNTMKDNGEIDIFVNIQNLTKVLPENTGVCSLNFTINFDSEQFLLKESDPLTINSENLIKNTSNLKYKIGKDSIDVAFLDASLMNDVLKSDGNLFYITLIARNPRQLYNSDDYYPINFKNGSVGAVLYNTVSYSASQSSDIVGLPYKIGGYNEYPKFEGNGEEFNFAFDDSSVMKVNESDINMDVAPVIIEGETLYPARFLLEQAGFDISWNDETEVAEFLAPLKSLNIDTKNNKVYVNAKALDFGIPTYNDRTYVNGETLRELFGDA
ncbi:MAG: stalk domain-containing protein, partial [Oscillospiraceae bacterium]